MSINLIFLLIMNNYPSQTLPPIYPYPIIRQYSSQPYYYSYDEYPSSPQLSRISYATPSLPYDQYSSPVKYYNNDDETYLFEQHHHRHHQHQHQHHHHQQQHSYYPNHGQYLTYQKPNRAYNISRYKNIVSNLPHIYIYIFFYVYIQFNHLFFFYLVKHNRNQQQ